MEKSDKELNKHPNEKKQQENFETNTGQYENNQKISKHASKSKVKILQNHDNLIINCNSSFDHGYLAYLYKFSIKYNKRFYSTELFDNNHHATKSPDNKNLFITNYTNGFSQFNIRTNKLIKKLGGPIKFRQILVSYDNEYLFTISGMSESLTKWSMKTKNELKAWNVYDNLHKVFSLTCSYDNKYLMLGYSYGYLSILDIQKNKIVKNVKALSSTIWAVAFTKDSKYAYISDFSGNLNIMCMENFEFIEDFIKIGANGTLTICLSNDDKKLLVVSNEMLKIFDLDNREVVKEFRESDYKKVSLINGGESILLSGANGELTIIDFETLEIVKTFDAKHTTNYKLIIDLVVI